MKLATAEQMRSLDATVINRFGVPGLELMEHAGRQTVDAMVERFGPLAGKLVSIFAGPGNNGGDGLVIARLLREQGAHPHVYLLAPPEKFHGDAAVNLSRVRDLPIPLDTILTEDDLAACEEEFGQSFLAVDAIFGTGLGREVAGRFAHTIQRLNQSPCPVVAVDVPSGLHADTGLPLGVCVRADMTVTFGLAKPGLMVSGKRFAGEVVVADIGIPTDALQQADIYLELLEKNQVARWLPSREPDAHKGTFGHLLVLAGSTGKTGAAILTALGALRSGVGLVTLAVPRSLNPIFETALPEAMTIPLPRSESALSADDHAVLRTAMEGKQALVVGPGLGTAESTGVLVKRLCCECALPMVVDADGLNLLAPEIALLKSAPGPRIVTPHPGEMARLLGTTAKEVQKNRIPTALDFAVGHGVFVVLKGAGTVIAAPDGRAAINPTGNPGMATGGMGDVLAGLIAGLLAQGVSPWRAACLGAYNHGLAGDRLAATGGVPFGFTASELARELPRAFSELYS